MLSNFRHFFFEIPSLTLRETFRDHNKVIRSEREKMIIGFIISLISCSHICFGGWNAGNVFFRYQGSTQSVNTRPFQEPPADYEDGSDDDLDDNILALDYHRKSMQSQHRPSLIIQVEPAIDYGEPGQQSQEPVSPASHLHPLRHREQPSRADIFVTQWPPSDAASYDDMTI